MYRIVVLLFCSFIFTFELFSNGNNYHKYYQQLHINIEQVTCPVFAEYSVSIVSFGAKPSNDVINTEAFSKAILHVTQKGGGKVIVPRGVWQTGPITLKSNINLHLEEGAVILFYPDFDLYPTIKDKTYTAPSYSTTSPISAYNCENIAITGKGVIDGNGDSWRYRKKGKFTESEWNEIVKSGGVVNAKGDMWYPTAEALEGHEYKGEMSFDLAVKYKVFLRPKMINLEYCKRVLLQGVTFQNAPNWNVHPSCCEDLIVDNVYIRSPWNAQNSDAIDVESCNRVLIVNSKFDVGDDAICIKSGKDEEGRKRAIPSQNILIDNCIVYHGHGGFVIGSEMSGGVKNVIARNCNFMGTDIGLRFKSTRGRGGVVENIYVDNIKMMKIKNEAIVFELFYGRADPSAPIPAVSEKTPRFRNFVIKNINCISAESALTTVGLPEMPVENIKFENMLIKSKQGIIIKWAKNFDFSNVTLDISEAEPIKVIESSNIKTDGIKYVKATQQVLSDNSPKH